MESKEDRQFNEWCIHTFLGLIGVEIFIVVIFCLIHGNESDKGVVTLANYFLFYALSFWNEYGFEITFAYSTICVVFPSLMDEREMFQRDETCFQFYLFKFAFALFLIASVLSSLVFSILYSKGEFISFELGDALIAIVGAFQFFLYYLILCLISCFIYTMRILFSIKSSKKVCSRCNNLENQGNQKTEGFHLDLAIKECPQRCFHLSTTISKVSKK